MGDVLDEMLREHGVWEGLLVDSQSTKSVVQYEGLRVHCCSDPAILKITWFATAVLEGLQDHI